LELKREAKGQIRFISKSYAISIIKRKKSHEYEKEKGGFSVFAFTYFHPILSLIAGILILIIPRLLNYIVAIYLIIFGISGLVYR